MTVSASVCTDEKGAVPFHFLQTDFWASFKGRHGWKAYRFLLTVSDNEAGITFNTTLSLMVRRFAKFFSIAYVPLGPEIPEDVQKSIQYRSDAYLELLEKTAAALKPFLPGDCFCLRMDPPVEFSDLTDKEQWLSGLKTRSCLHKSPTDIQPPDTVLYDLTRPDDQQLAAMKPKWRYNIHLAEKKGVQVSSCGPEAVDEFYSLFEQTAARDGIAVHSKEYYRSLLSLPHHENIRTDLWIARHEGTSLAGIITLFTDTEAVYLYGASSNEKRNLMPAYLLQWTAIQAAKAFGSKVYDFYGIPPTDDEHHPMHGLYRFKTGFGGQIVHRAGSIDVPLRKGVYGAYITAEKLRAFWFKKVRKLFLKK